MSATAPNVELRLAAANDRLARLLNRDRCPLVTGGARAADDPLWVWGVLGGKDVGKTTLIRALAGQDQVDVPARADAGTTRATAYLNAADADALTARFAPLTDAPIDIDDSAPDAMRSLVLVDLPDFDSTFQRHVEQVRAIAPLLDGVIWLTTPKKVGDRKAIDEIHRVLKDCRNFVYVVNKMDWVLVHAGETVETDCRRIHESLDRQVAACHGDGPDGRAFTVSARYATADGVLDAVANGRDLPDRQSLLKEEPSIRRAAERIAGSFDQLRRTLTTPPTPDAASANKSANLRFQTSAQVKQIRSHYRTARVLDALDALLSPQSLNEIVERSITDAYAARVLQSLNHERRLFAEWSTALFRRRVGVWSLLGIIAWPVILLGALPIWRRASSSFRDVDTDPFRHDGIPLEDRLRALCDGLRARCTAELARLNVQTAAPESLGQQFRTDASALADAQRDAIIAASLHASPGLIGRFIRRALPLAVLIWFPLVQPLLAAALSSGNDQSLQQWTWTVVTALSATNMLTGLSVSLLMLAAMTAAVYSRAARDAMLAAERLQSASPRETAAPLVASVTDAATRPFVAVRDDLTSMMHSLESWESDTRPPNHTRR